MVTASDVRELLDERPELRPAVEAVLEAEAPWTFHDVDVDSGRFGELVSRGIVEDAAGEGYRVTDPEAVRQALAGDGASPPEADADQSATWSVPFGVDSLSLPERRTAVLLVSGLVLVVVLRSLSFSHVFREGVVVLSANDPYYYRYFVERLVNDPSVSLSRLPPAVSTEEPLFVVSLWTVAELLGATDAAVGQVLAWYPVVSAVLTALLVYTLAVRVTADCRVGLAAVAMLAVLPEYAVRTGLGFADHHAFDYPWLVLTLVGLTVVGATSRRENIERIRLALAAGAIAVGSAGTVLAWKAGPLLLVPVGVYLAVETLAAVSEGTSPVTRGGPVVGAVVVAAVLVWVAHAGLHWHTRFVAATPALLAVGGVGVVAAGELWHRMDLSAVTLGAAEVVGVGAGALLLRTGWPAFWARLTTAVTEVLLARRNIAEVVSLFDEARWILSFGFLLLFALPYMAWGSYRGRQDARWRPVVVYGWYFLLLAAVQVRFVGELAAVLAVFAGFGFVHVAAWVDTARTPAPLGRAPITTVGLPDRRKVATLAFLFVLLTSVSLVMVPVKMQQTAVSDGQYEAAMGIRAYSDERGTAYPQNYVFSRWPDNRMYNYFLNGQSRSYVYAQDNYHQFVRSTDPERWYRRLNPRSGFVVTTDDAAANRSTLGSRLHVHHGSRTRSGDGLAHYRLIAVGGDGSYKAFALVTGAVVTGTARPNETVTVSTTVTVDGTTFQYVRGADTDADGSFSVRVAYPGTYEYRNRTVTVPESAVSEGATVGRATDE